MDLEPLPQDPFKVRIKAYEDIMKFLQYQLKNNLITDKFPIELACECMENLQYELNVKQAAAEANNSLPTFETANQQMVLAEARLEAYDTLLNFMKLYSSNLSSASIETLEIARNSVQAIQEVILAKNINLCEISSSAKTSSDRLTENSPRSDSSNGIAAKRTNSLDSLLGIGEMSTQQVFVPVVKDAKINQLATDQQTEKQNFSQLTIEDIEDEPEDIEYEPEDIEDEPEDIEDKPEARHVATLSPRKRSLSADNLNTVGELRCSPPKQRKQDTKQEDVLVEDYMKDTNLETMEELSHSLGNLQLEDEDNEKEKNVSQNTNKDDGPSSSA